MPLSASRTSSVSPEPRPVGGSPCNLWTESLIASTALRSPNPPPPPRRRGGGETEVTVRPPARFGARLQQRRRELATSLTGAILELVRRGLEEPPPGLRNLRQRDVRQGVVEEAALATLLAVEQVRLELEMSIPKAAEVSESTAYAAAMAAEQRLLVARQALGEMKR